MKKILTAIIIALTLGASCASANEAKYFKVTKDSPNLGGVVGNTAVYIYPGNDISGLTNDVQMKMLTNYTKKTICGKEGTRKLVADFGLKVLYIYPSKGLKSAVMVTVTNCDGYVPAKK